MPNWCMNKLDIQGDSEQIIKLYTFIESEDTKFDFNKVVPIPADEEENWHLWRIHNWGTKWLPDNVERSIRENYGEISFWTAWSPASPIVKALSVKFPELRFVLWYEEAGMDFSGYEVWQEGILLDEDAGDFNKYWTSYDEDDNINEEYNFPEV